MPEKETLAAMNAVMNGLSTILLISGFVAIRRGNWRVHATLMISALATSAIFLVGYLTSYYVHGDRSSGLEAGWLRTVYFLVLFPHIILAVVMLPMIATTLYRALRRRFAAHKKIARPTFGIWAYVSITGIVVYWMLYHLIPWYQRAG